ncbi:LysR family transcriptional regulator [Pandoraea communis]|uniref:LysR family transcriptional regulator n=1 Tax=Pandoraea communis TaxID=2508297 RepID=A0A5E4URL9_9BURK|nr:LysR family transcriptional regulator [Pandoraea communis]VVE02577.1 LysR family transcriptional regulator [Pandoraea communis]
MNVSLRQLKVFMVVARSKNFSRAGAEIGLTQPAISRCINELEGQLGLRLVDRTTREVALTDAGITLAGSLDRVLDELEIALLQTHGAEARTTGRVRIGAAPTISATLLPRVLLASQATYPDIALALVDQMQRAVLDSVRAGDVDFGIVVAPQGADDLTTEHLMSEPFCLVCRNDHPLASQAAVHWSELSGENLVLLNQSSGSRPLIDRALTTQKVQGTITQELGHVSTIFRMVQEGLGISVLPPLALPLPENSTLAVRPLLPAFERNIVLVRRKNRSLSPVAHTVWELIHCVVRERNKGFAIGAERHVAAAAPSGN